MEIKLNNVLSSPNDLEHVQMIIDQEASTDDYVGLFITKEGEEVASFVVKINDLYAAASAFHLKLENSQRTEIHELQIKELEKRDEIKFYDNLIANN